MGRTRGLFPHIRRTLPRRKGFLFSSGKRRLTERLKRGQARTTFEEAPVKQKRPRSKKSGEREEEGGKAISHIGGRVGQEVLIALLLCQGNEGGQGVTLREREGRESPEKPFQLKRKLPEQMENGGSYRATRKVGSKY